MPIYVLKCTRCGEICEVLRQIEEDAAFCPCGGEMEKLPTFPAMVKIKGSGGYPSRRKYVGGSAAYCGGAKAWNRGLRNEFNPEVDRS